MTVDEALDVLRAAGWEIREDVNYGVLSGPFLMVRYMGEGSRHTRMVAQMPWTPTDDPVYRKHKRDVDAEHELAARIPADELAREFGKANYSEVNSDD